MKINLLIFVFILSLKSQCVYCQSQVTIDSAMGDRIYQKIESFIDKTKNSINPNLKLLSRSSQDYKEMVNYFERI